LYRQQFMRAGLQIVAQILDFIAGRCRPVACFPTLKPSTHHPVPASAP